MKQVICLVALAMFVGMGNAAKAQDLKDLRARPDTIIVDSRTTKPLSIRNVKVPIPELGLSVDYWKHWTKIGFNLNQASFSESWRDGGVNSMAWATTAWHKSEYNRNDFNFTTEFDLRYGVLANQDQRARKNVDRILWDNKLAYKFSSNWSVFTSVSFESIFAPGYENPAAEDRGLINTRFMSPGYLTESLGLEYKPDDTFSLRFGTGSARQTFVLDSDIPPNGQRDGVNTRFGVLPGRTVRNELGFQLLANLDRDLTKNLHIKSRYMLLADYTEVTNPDHRLDVTLTAKITSFISVTANGTMVYDRTWKPDPNRGAPMQYSQALAMGVLFNFPRQ